MLTCYNCKIYTRDINAWPIMAKSKLILNKTSVLIVTTRSQNVTKKSCQGKIQIINAELLRKV